MKRFSLKGRKFSFFAQLLEDKFQAKSQVDYQALMVKTMIKKSRYKIRDMRIRLLNLQHKQKMMMTITIAQLRISPRFMIDMEKGTVMQVNIRKSFSNKKNKQKKIRRRKSDFTISPKLIRQKPLLKLRMKAITNSF